MQEGGVRRIDSDLQSLQPVALIEPLEGEAERVGCFETIVGRKRRRLAGAQIGEDDAVPLPAGIGRLPDLGVEAAVGRLGRLFQAIAADVVKPAVKGAAQAAVLEPPETQIGAPVPAVAVEQPVGARLVPEQDQIFAQQAHRQDRPFAGQFLRQRRRLPVAAQELSGRGAGAAPGDQLVLFRAKHGLWLWFGGHFVRAARFLVDRRRKII